MNGGPTVIVRTLLDSTSDRTIEGRFIVDTRGLYGVEPAAPVETKSGTQAAASTFAVSKHTIAVRAHAQGMPFARTS